MDSIRANAASLSDQQYLLDGNKAINDALGRLAAAGYGQAFVSLQFSLVPLQVCVNSRINAEQQVADILRDYAQQVEQIRNDALIAKANLEEAEMALQDAQSWKQNNDPTDPVPASVQRELVMGPGQVSTYQARLDELDQQRQELGSSIASQIASHTSAVSSSLLPRKGVLANLFSSPVASTVGIDPATAAALARTLLNTGSMSPTQINAWYENLEEAEQHWLVRHYPAVIGNLDGIPPNFREQANLIQMNTDLKALNTKIEELETEIKAAMTFPSINNEYLETLIRDKALFNARRQDIQDLKNQLNKWNRGKKNADDMLVLLGYHGNTAHVQAIIATGDITHGTNMTVHVPGMNTTVGGTTITDAMTTLNIQRDITKKELNNTGSTAAVYWLGYNAPDWGEVPQRNSVVLPFAAWDASDALVRFSQGIKATSKNSTEPLLVFSGHSYGTVVGLNALTDPDHAFDRAVFAGGPGVPLNVDPKLPIEDMFFASNATDFVQIMATIAPVHGVPFRALGDTVNHLNVGEITHNGQQFSGTSFDGHSYTHATSDPAETPSPTSTDLNIGIIMSGKGSPYVIPKQEIATEYPQGSDFG
ncbi:hypothetical protein FYJ24_05825 [Actinomycetaceae bacterium WB03_NA08]|uniref:DUF1023 domain-containing protein n=1 Tax=Scrofimicrobium canadense TaxID=2652290 RepID=A0A6N7W4F3_9ACTO|nr:alpha/beta hydrolase [Scrofimicrobium canadense]MSS84291.1 hypothetical protein [Scrofimicrobium canadense]